MQSVDEWLHYLGHSYDEWLYYVWHSYLWSSPREAAWTVAVLAGFATFWNVRVSRRPPRLSESERPQWMVEQNTVNTSGILGALVITNLLLGAILGVLAFGAMR